MNATMRGRFLVLIVALVAGLTMMAQEAQAQFQLRLEQAGFPSKTVLDNSPEDTDPLLGRISYLGAYGTFTVTVNTGLSKPGIGNGGTQADMDLNSSDFTTSTGGTLVVTIADTGFTFPNNNAGNLMSLKSQVGGTFGGLGGPPPAGTSLTFRAWANPTNASPLSVDPSVIPAGSVGVLPMGPFFTSPFSQNSAPVNFTKGAGPYSLFNQATIYLPGSGRIGFDQFTRVEGQDCTGKLGNYVWNDLNHNGIQESGEPGIGGITVTLMKDGNPSATTTTDASGLYQFTGLCAASYTVEVPPQAGLTGYVPSPTLQGGDSGADSNPNPTTVLFATDNNDDQTIDFGYYIPAPHLTLVKSPKGGTFNQGDPVSFIFVIGNDGGSAATNVVLNDQLPGNGGLVWMVAPGNPSQGSCSISSNLLSCNLGTIQKAQSVTLTVISAGTGTPMAACQAQPNPIATATADGGLSATDSGSLNCVPPQLSIVKTPKGGTFAVGAAVNFTIVVSNPAPAGASPASNVMLNDTLPNNGGLVWNSATASQGSCTLTTNNLSCALGSIAAGASVTVTVNSTATTPASACQLQPNPSARATGDGGLDVQDSGSMNCDFTASTTLGTKSVLPATTVAVGTSVTITVTETNTGNTPISNVNVTGTGACTTYSPASLASLAAGASADFTCTFTASTTANWSATGHGTDAVGRTVSEDGETTSGSVTVQQASTTLTMKTVMPGTTVLAGTPVTITVTETNTGTSAITNVNVTGTGCTAWTPASVASLAAGDSTDFSCTFTPATTTGWTATGNGKDALNQDVSLENETVSGTVTVFTASTTLTTKSVTPGSSVIAGTAVTITVTEANTGNSTITNVNVTGTGCTAWTPASVASLAAGDSTDFSCTFTPATTTGWTATGNGKDVNNNDVSLTNETTSGTVTVFTASTTLTTKTVSPGTTVIAGTPVTLTVTEKNTGNSTITNVNVTGTGCTAWTPASVASLAAGDSTDFSCTFTPATTTGWTATGHGKDVNNNDVSLANETTSGTVTVFTASTTLTTKSVSPGTTVIAGTPVTLTVTEKNTGNSTITSVNVTGTGCTAWTPASVASLAAGVSTDFSCTFTPATTTGWTATGHGKDVNNNDVSLANETTSGTVTVFTASTTLTTKSVSPGTTVIAGTPVTLTVTEKNTGNSTITSVNVTGTGCTAWTPASVASLAAGASADFSCTFSPATTTGWTATGHGKDVNNNDVSLANETTSGTVTVYTASTSLTTKTVNPGATVVSGTPVTITVNEKNTGNSTITSVYVTGTGCTTWTPASVASLAAGASADFSCTFTPTTATNWTATGHGKDVLGKDVSLVGETTSGTITVTPPPPQFCSYTPGGWGAPPNGGNVAAMMYANFSAVYGNGGVVVGNRTQGASIPYAFSSLANYYLKFTSASAITTFLPNGGTPNKLLKNNTNPPPTNGDWGGEFGSQVLALQLNVNFSAAGKVPKPGFATAKVVSGPLAGLTATQVLTLANQALGGNTSVLTPYGITIAQLTTILSSINGSMDNCTTNTGFMQ